MYAWMFAGCSSLVDVPDLMPDAHLSSGRYTGYAQYQFLRMFSKSALSSVDRELFADLGNELFTFGYMFEGCRNLRRVHPKLFPFSYVGRYSAYGMFSGCTSLEAAPELDVLSAAEAALGWMFDNCVSLTSAGTSALPGEFIYTETGNQCGRMFTGCRALSSAPALPARSLTPNCYTEMFRGSGITSAPELPAEALETGCYNRMFESCNNLTRAPELPATAAADKCYQQMFFNCKKLQEASMRLGQPALSSCADMFRGCAELSSVSVGFTEWQDESATSCWLSGVSPSGVFTCPEQLGAETTIFRGPSFCPEGWRVVNE